MTQHHKRPRGNFRWDDIRLIPESEPLAKILDLLNENLDPATRDFIDDQKVEFHESTITLTLGTYYPHVYRFWLSPPFDGHGTFHPIRPEQVVRLQLLRSRQFDASIHLIRDIRTGRHPCVRPADFALIHEMPGDGWDFLRAEVTVQRDAEGEFIDAEVFLKWAEGLRKRGDL